MSNPKRRNFVDEDLQWRKPEFESHINKYPFGLASLIAGSAAAIIGLMISFVLVILIWLLAAHGNESTIQVVRAAAIAWQGAQLVPIEISGIAIGILPWGFLIIPIIAIWKSLHWALKSAQPSDGRKFISIATYFSLTYGFFSLVISLLSSTEDLRTSFIQAFIRTTILAALVSIVVLFKFAPAAHSFSEKLPREFAIILKPGLITFAVLFFISSVVTTAALIMRFNELKAVAGLMAPNALDQIFLILLCIGYLPTLISWTFSYLLGAGIHLGGASVISLTVASPGALPAIPLLSILPSSVSIWTKLLITIPILIGVLIYFLIPREHWKAQGENYADALAGIVRISEVIRILLATTVLAIFTFLITFFSSGSLGTDYLIFIGPNPVTAAAWIYLAVGSAALLTLVMPRLVLTISHLSSNRQQNKLSQLANSK